MNRPCELHGAGMPIRQIDRELGVSRNTARRHLWAPEVPRPAPRPPGTPPPAAEGLTTRCGHACRPSARHFVPLLTADRRTRA